jgi:hypothetical protein
MDKNQLEDLKELGKNYKNEWAFLCKHKVFMDNILDKLPWHMVILAEVLLAHKEVSLWADFEKNYLSKVKSKLKQHVTQYSDDYL